MLVTLFVGYLTLLPFIVTKWGFEGPKLIYFFSGSFFLAMFWIYKILKDRSKINLYRADGFYFLWLLVLTIASFFGVHPIESIFGGSYRHQGIIFFLGLWLAGKTVAILRENQRKLLVKGIAVAVLIEAIIVFVQFATGKLYFGKPLGTLGEANAVAGFLAIGSYFVLETFPKVYLLLPIAAVLIEQSRAGILALAPMLLRYSKKILPLLGLMIIGLVVFISFQKDSSVFENRPLFWKLGINKVIEKPILGYGAESGEYVYDAAFKKAEMPLEGLIIDRSHNLLLDIAMWSGTVGLSIFLYWFYLSFVGLKDLKRKMAVLTFLIFAMLQPLGVSHWVLLVVILNI